jgi:hypothetical protein
MSFSMARRCAFRKESSRLHLRGSSDGLLFREFHTEKHGGSKDGHPAFPVSDIGLRNDFIRLLTGISAWPDEPDDSNSN